MEIVPEEIESNQALEESRSQEEAQRTRTFRSWKIQQKEKKKRVLVRKLEQLAFSCPNGYLAKRNIFYI